MLRYKTETRPGLVALYDTRSGNGVGQFLQPRSPHEALYVKGCGHKYGVPQTLGFAGILPLVLGRAWPLTKTPPPVRGLPHRTRQLLGQTVQAYVWRNAGKKLSRPLKVIGTVLEGIDRIAVTSY